MPETITRKSACILCYINCGIEVEIEDGKMKRVKGDKDNPKSLGYICQKAGRLPFYANDRALRLTSPLRRNAELAGLTRLAGTWRLPRSRPS